MTVTETVIEYRDRPVPVLEKCLKKKSPVPLPVQFESGGPGLFCVDRTHFQNYIKNGERDKSFHIQVDAFCVEEEKVKDEPVGPASP